MEYRIVIDGEDSSFTCRAEQHLLQGMRNVCLGMPQLDAIPEGCRGGGCGVCRIRVLAGEYEARKMSRRFVTLDEQAQDIVLACRVYPRSDLLIALAPPENSPETAGAQSNEAVIEN